MRFTPIVLLLVVCSQPALAQGTFEYRDYRLGSSLADTIALDAARVTAPKILHRQPALIQEVVWRAPYTGPQGEDPVYDVTLRFVDDQLYQIVASYARERTTGLTREDMVAILSSTYGPPLLRDSRTLLAAVTADVAENMVLVAQWEDAGAVLSLVRSRLDYWPQFQLAVVSKRLNEVARSAIGEALRLDAIGAPQRERDRQADDAAARADAEQKAREANKAAFRP